MTTIWSNDIETRETILASAKREANRLASPAIEHGGDIADEDWLVRTVLATAWKDLLVEGGPADETTYRGAIGRLRCEDPRLARDVAEYNTLSLADERANLSAIKLPRPVILIGTAGLWDGNRTVDARIRFDDVGDILRHVPWNDMDIDTWSIDENDDLRYTGIHHDGTNTCVYRMIRQGRHIRAHAPAPLVHTLTEPLGPLVRKLYGIPEKR